MQSIPTIKQFAHSNTSQSIHAKPEWYLKKRRSNIRLSIRHLRSRFGGNAGRGMKQANHHWRHTCQPNNQWATNVQPNSQLSRKAFLPELLYRVPVQLTGLCIGASNNPSPDAVPGTWHPGIQMAQLSIAWAHRHKMIANVCCLALSNVWLPMCVA